MRTSARPPSTAPGPGRQDQEYGEIRRIHGQVRQARQEAGPQEPIVHGDIRREGLQAGEESLEVP